MVKLMSYWENGLFRTSPQGPRSSYAGDTHHETVGGAPQTKTAARIAKKPPTNSLIAVPVPPGGLLSRVCVICWNTDTWKHEPPNHVVTVRPYFPRSPQHRANINAHTPQVTLAIVIIILDKQRNTSGRSGKCRQSASITAFGKRTPWCCSARAYFACLVFAVLEEVCRVKRSTSEIKICQPS